MQGIPLTPQQKQKFLAKLKSTNGNVSRAAQAAGFQRCSAYRYKANDPDFSAAWDDVLASVYDAAEDELYRRAVKGWKEPVFYKGDQIGDILKKSDRLLEFFLKGNRAEKYRERMDLNAHHTGSLDVNIQASIDSIYGNGTSDQTKSPGFDDPDDPNSEGSGDPEGLA